MRPPRRSWQLTSKAFNKLFDALEIGLSEQHNVSVRMKSIREARLAILELDTFINESEECEEP